MVLGLTEVGIYSESFDAKKWYSIRLYASAVQNNMTVERYKCGQQETPFKIGKTSFSLSSGIALLCREGIILSFEKWVIMGQKIQRLLCVLDSVIIGNGL